MPEAKDPAVAWFDKVKVVDNNMTSLTKSS